MSDGKEIKKQSISAAALIRVNTISTKQSTRTCKQVRLRGVLPNYSYDATMQATYKLK